MAWNWSIKPDCNWDKSSVGAKRYERSNCFIATLSLAVWWLSFLGMKQSFNHRRAVHVDYRRLKNMELSNQLWNTLKNRWSLPGFPLATRSLFTKWRIEKLEEQVDIRGRKSLPLRQSLPADSVSLRRLIIIVKRVNTPLRNLSQLILDKVLVHRQTSWQCILGKIITLFTSSSPWPRWPFFLVVLQIFNINAHKCCWDWISGFLPSTGLKW